MQMKTEQSKEQNLFLTGAPWSPEVALEVHKSTQKCTVAYWVQWTGEALHWTGVFVSLDWMPLPRMGVRKTLVQEKER